ncbi:MAG: hypothetical protein C5B50_02650 [Verrucomicrobia bacterium]|nr:MAG: hypothetical protein C5B50_02650 [Verrucomicrobiota bacterium]
MPTSQELVDAIGQSLGAVVQSGFSTRTAACDSYEVFVFSLVIDAARRVGAQISYRSIGISAPFNGQFTFRTGPGNIYSRAYPYTYARIEFSGHGTLEVHVGIYAAGVSGVRHECDVAVLPFDEAENCRRQRVHPRCSELWLAAECKFYSSELSIDLGRSFLGLVKEIHQDSRFFVTNSSSETLEKLLAHHKIRWQRKLVPGNADLVNRLRSLFEEVFQNYLALG